MKNEQNNMNREKLQMGTDLKYFLIVDQNSDYLEFREFLEEAYGEPITVLEADGRGGLIINSDWKPSNHYVFDKKDPIAWKKVARTIEESGPYVFVYVDTSNPDSYGGMRVHYDTLCRHFADSHVSLNPKLKDEMPLEKRVLRKVL